ncbi:magnesium chelatase family protein [Clostridium pascui]|uniref:YifB family Mg chelatase-like AAA ATPase n=1 Tax=Clostridium pascui TaxID=46609 RepID=UPI00195A6CC1|nr:YifB family Mg chelatase-like AAA ATPase [Clostridium pascui]MBM7868967.1 magnesium chelatase family protein [Clostridium pascui]
MAIKVNSAAFTGVEGIMVAVEVDIGRGLPSFNIVGLGDIAVKESKERVRTSLINSGFEFPVGRITVNLAPADVKKEGSLFDLAIAIGILKESGQINMDIDEYIFLGELSLRGELRAIRGTLPIIIGGMENKFNKFIIPVSNSIEASLVKNSEVYPLETLKEVVSYLQYKDLMPFYAENPVSKTVKYNIDFEEVIGQESVKRAIEVAAAGNHNIILYGPPGTGKTMIAERIPTILPDLSYEESLECTKIYSVAGELNKEYNLISNRPFRSPHHTASKIALIGGGSKLLPGEISLAHNGVLYLDEMLEFNRNSLEALRQPLENRKVKISKSTGTVEYPCNFMLVSSLNPCPCGNYGSGDCICTDYERKRYIKKLSGPLMDRIDIFAFVNKLNFKDIGNGKKEESSKLIKKRIERARELQKERFQGLQIRTNGEMSSSQIKKYCVLGEKEKVFIEKVYNKFNFSTRVYHKVLKLARTLADLDGKDLIEEQDLIEAIQYRRFLSDVV